MRTNSLFVDRGIPNRNSDGIKYLANEIKYLFFQLLVSFRYYFVETHTQSIIIKTLLFPWNVEY